MSQLNPPTNRARAAGTAGPTDHERNLMTTENATTERPPVAVAMTSMLLCQHEHKLPAVTAIHVETSNGIFTLCFTTLDAFDAWAKHLGLSGNVSSQAYQYREDVPKTLYTVYGQAWGWSVHLSGSVPVASPSELPQSAVEALTELAAAHSKES